MEKTFFSALGIMVYMCFCVALFQDSGFGVFFGSMVMLFMVGLVFIIVKNYKLTENIEKKQEETKNSKEES